MSGFVSDLEHGYIDAVSIGPSMSMYAAFARNFVGPVGLLWGLGMRNEKQKRCRFMVWYMWTMPSSRHQGVQRLIHKRLFDDGYNATTTHSASSEVTEQALKKLGYMYDKQACLWVCTKKRFWGRRK